ncbi:hypothetical protein DdX_08034 [Ditylenchus destructor]|uniref:Uncharacterized protein n=1 Tax=Ditylenchus destructor TaxID=166010 RepID=A0AAD4N2S6_9BILA|nr:hypothetical protein DdX_08034 [Ditylenchus destructor]
MSCTSNLSEKQANALFLRFTLKYANRFPIELLGNGQTLIYIRAQLKTAKMHYIMLTALLVVLFQCSASGLPIAYNNPLFGNKFSLVRQQDMDPNEMFGPTFFEIHRETRMDPAWNHMRHIGLGKRLFDDTNRWKSNANKGHRTWAMIGLGRR